MTMTVAFCAVPQDALPQAAARDCTLDHKPAVDNALQAWVRITNTSAEAQKRLLVISPYYHPLIEIYQLEKEGWTLSQTGGSRLGGTAATASLGGHRFAMVFSAGVTELLVRMPSDPAAPELTHFKASLEDADKVYSREQTLLALHLGMLLMLLVLMFLGWMVHPSVMQFRLLLMTAATLLCVAIGSGAFFLLWPSASPHLWGMVVFGASVVLRIACMAWIYETMISPFHKGSRYKQLSRGLYAIAWTTVLLFAVNQSIAGWVLTMMVLPAVFALSAYGLYTATDMPPRLRLILKISLSSLLILNLLGIAGMVLTQGQSNFPVYISRLIDLSLPMGMLATTLLRNQVLEHEYRQARKDVVAQNIALEYERQSRNEKRMLLDMLTHEIKNPLASINFAITTLSQTTEGQQGQTPRRLENISRSILTIDQIIEHCNLANGIEDERITPRLECIDLTHMLLGLLGTTQEPQRFLFSERAPKIITSDLYLLRVVAANLIDNAIKYAPADTTICIEISAGDKTSRGMWGFRISNGLAPNMAPDPEKIFERYYRHPLAQELRGSGLGLSICRQICQLLGGRIWYHSNQTSITFEVSFESP